MVLGGGRHAELAGAGAPGSAVMGRALARRHAEVGAPSVPGDVAGVRQRPQVAQGRCAGPTPYATCGSMCVGAAVHARLHGPCNVSSFVACELPG